MWVSFFRVVNFQVVFKFIGFGVNFQFGFGFWLVRMSCGLVVGKVLDWAVFWVAGLGCPS